MKPSPGYSDDQIDAILAGERTGNPEADALADNLASFRQALGTAPSGPAQWVHLAAMRQVADREIMLSRRRTRRFATTAAALLGALGFVGVTGGLAAAESLPGSVQRGVEAVARTVGFDLGDADPAAPVKRDRPETPRSDEGSTVDANAGESGTTPGQSGVTPGQSGVTPGQSGVTPGQSDTSPGQSGVTPGQSGTSPGQSGVTPGQSGTSPGQSGVTPGQSGTSPGQSGTTPGQSGTTPGQSGTTPGQTGTTPGGGSNHG